MPITVLWLFLFCCCNNYIHRQMNRAFLIVGIAGLKASSNLEEYAALNELHSSLNSHKQLQDPTTLTTAC
jgi:hypothetical protein